MESINVPRTLYSVHRVRAWGSPGTGFLIVFSGFCPSWDIYDLLVISILNIN